MSVREDLAKILAGGHITSDSIMWAVADELLKAHAHELAEEIRDFAARRLQIDSDDETYGMNMAADLIDPKVEK